MRNLLIGMVAAVVVVVGVGGGALLLRGNDDAAIDDTASTAPADESSATTASAAAAPDITWREVDAPLPDHVDDIITVDGQFVVIGRTGDRIEVWRSADGEVWEGQPTGEPLPDVWLRSFEWAGGRFTAFGQRVAADSGTGAVVMATSADGSAWELAELDVPVTARDDPLLRTEPYVIDYAAGPDGAVLFASVQVDLDIDALIEPHAPPDRFGYGVSYGIDGAAPGGGTVEVIDEGGEVVFQATLAELGVGPETLALLQDGQPGPAYLWHTTDYVTWQRASSPFGNESHLEQVVRGPAGYVAFVGGIGGSALWTSEDGSTWTEAASPLADAGYVGRLTATSRGLLASGLTATGPGLWLSPDGASWTAVSDDSFADTPEQSVLVNDVSAGGAGFVAAGNTFEQPPMPDLPPVTVEQDGKSVTFVQGADESTITVTDLASGEVLLDVVERVGELRFEPPDHIREDPELLVLVDPDTGEDIVAIPHERLEAAFDAAFSGEQFTAPDPGLPDSLLWYSADGATWDRRRVAELLGFEAAPAAVAVGEDRIVMVVVPIDPGDAPNEDDLEGFGAPRARLFIGTPTGSPGS